MLSLRAYCLNITSVPPIAENAINTARADSEINQIISATPIPALTQLSQKVDKLDSQRQQVIAMIAKSSNDVDKIRLGNEAAAIKMQIDSVKNTDAAFAKASTISEKIQTAYELADSAYNAAAHDDLSRETRWFKEGFFVLFDGDNIRVSLKELNKKAGEITVDISAATGTGVWKKLRQNVVITAANPFVFTIANRSFILYLNRIGRGGNNPFTQAAYITLAGASSSK